MLPIKLSNLPRSMRGADLSPPPPGKQKFLPTPIRRLKLRILPSGVMSWVIPEPRSFTIGQLEIWPWVVVEAEAYRLLRLIDQGINPQTERAARSNAPTVAELIDEFWRDVDATNPPKLKPSTRREYEGRVRQWIYPYLGKKLVTEVTRRDLEKLHALITADTPTRANRVLSTVSVLFTLAVKRAMRPDNPAKGVAHNKEYPRYRFLEGEELVRFLASLEQCPSLSAKRAIRLLLLTGARKNEVLSMRWDQVNLATGTWAKPHTMTKTERLHVVPLSAPACQLLVEIHSEAAAHAATTGKPISPWVFPARRSGLHIKEVKSAWASILKRADIRDLRRHDLRHFAGSFLASTGVGLPLIGRLLGHTQARTTERYSHVALDPVRQQVERLGAFITAVANGQSGEIVELPEQRKTR
jgi:integrase